MIRYFFTDRSLFHQNFLKFESQILCFKFSQKKLFPGFYFNLERQKNIPIFFFSVILFID